MTKALPDLQPFVDVALRLAREAGAGLLQQRPAASKRPESKGQRRELVTAADRAAEHVVVGGLLAAFPDHAILAEEGVLTTKGQASKSAAWTWIVDPIDGTTNYVHGLPFFAVAIGLAHENVPVVGVVHAPALGQTFVASRGGGARLLAADGSAQMLHVSKTTDLGDALLATGFSYVRNEPGNDDNSGRLARVLPHCRDLRRLGSAELDLCYVAAGVYDGYWEMYLAPYDVAAGAVIVQEAGGRVTDLRGGDRWLADGEVLATNGRLHDAVMAHVGSA